MLGHVHISHILKMHHLFKNLFLNSREYIRQDISIYTCTMYIVHVTMSKEWSTQIVFMTPGAGVLVVSGPDHIQH